MNAFQFSKKSVAIAVLPESFLNTGYTKCMSGWFML